VIYIGFFPYFMESISISLKINVIYLWAIYVYKIKSKRNEQISKVFKLFLLVRHNLVFSDGSRKNQTTYLQYQRRFFHYLNLSRNVKPTSAHTIKVVNYYRKSTSTSITIENIIFQLFLHGIICKTFNRFQIFYSVMVLG
jgi:hypothetical protein